MLSFIMLSVIMLSVIMLSVILLSIALLSVVALLRQQFQPDKIKIEQLNLNVFVACVNQP
jgi:cation transporter-like permease